MRLQTGLARAAACVVGLACVACLVSGSSIAEVTPAAPLRAMRDDGHAEISLGVGKSRVVQLPSSYTDVMVGDPKIADVVPLNPHAVYIVGKGMGSTVLTVCGAGKRAILTANVVVSADLEDFKARMHEIIPGETDVAVHPANQSLVLSGTVTSPAVLKQVMDLADTYNPGKVVNMMTVQGTQQVMLSVRFVEMERTTAKNLGLNVKQTPTLCSAPPFAAVPLGPCNPQLSINSGDSLNFVAQTANNTFGTASVIWQVGHGDLSFLFDALEAKGLIKTLAEPTLVAMSGDTANFLAGGEFPIPVAQTASGVTGVLPTITIEYKTFGISLAFTPTIVQDGLINMVINPEVSSIDPTTSVQLGDISIPGIKVRRAHTTVELRDGESFTIAGLLSDNYQNNIRELPFIGDIPILGALFRSTSFQADQTELVMVVTPHLVTPRKATAATPADHFVPPSDFELFLFGAQSGKATDLRPEDRALMSIDPTKGGVDGDYGHVLY